MPLLLASGSRSELLSFFAEEYDFVCVKLEGYNLRLSHRRHVDVFSLTKFVLYVNAFLLWTTSSPAILISIKQKDKFRHAVCRMLSPYQLLVFPTSAATVLHSGIPCVLRCVRSHLRRS
jgi:hypothetical protein